MKREGRMARLGWLPGVLICLAAAVALVCIALTAGQSIEEANTPEQPSALNVFLETHYLESVSILPNMVLLALLVIIVQVDPYINPRQKGTMHLILLLVFLLVVQNYHDEYLSQGAPRPLARTLVAILGYIVRPLILALFIRLLHPEKRLVWVWALVGVNAAVYLTAIFSRLCFWIDEENLYHGGPLSQTCLLVSAVLMVYLFVISLRALSPRQRKETWVPVLALVIIMLGVFLDYNIGLVLQPISYLTIGIVASCVAYYVWLHLQFVREHEETLMAGQRLQMTLSQIKPHFLHNALTVIVDLCDTDPQKAKTATMQFSRYLRGNMESLGASEPVPFQQALEHTKLYLELEKLRFEDALEVVYDIACTDFRIPALTVEPLVENAVRHGIRETEDGCGTVTIATREQADCYLIAVTDDGIGFDPSKAPADGRQHVGIANVRERLAQLVGGRLEIRSVPGEGTTAVIIIPKEKEA